MYVLCYLLEKVTMQQAVAENDNNKMSSIEIEDSIDASGSYQLNTDENGENRTRRESIFTITKEGLTRVPSQVNLQAHKVKYKKIAIKLECPSRPQKFCKIMLVKKMATNMFIFNLLSLHLLK